MTKSKLNNTTATPSFDIKATGTIGADIIKANRLGSTFESRDVGLLTEATTAEQTASERYDYLVVVRNWVPAKCVSPTPENLRNGKTDHTKATWTEMQNLARAIKWTQEEKAFWKDTEGSDASDVKKTRGKLSDRASNLITKTWFKGIENAHRRANPDMYVKAKAIKKLTQTKVLDAMADAKKAIQGMRDDDESIFDANEVMIAIENVEKETKRKS
tara:strand:- start:311 stop:958 length:648 start_codon:yes stop_codon:yes gene_type:complete